MTMKDVQSWNLAHKRVKYHFLNTYLVKAIIEFYSYQMQTTKVHTSSSVHLWFTAYKTQYLKQQNQSFRQASKFFIWPHNNDYIFIWIWNEGFLK